MTHPVMYRDDDPLLQRLRDVCRALPGVEERVSHGRPTFRARKIFAVYGGSEKLRPGDHRQVPSALIFSPDPVDLPALDEDDRFFVPAYYGPYGARAIDLADPAIDWGEVAELVDASFRQVAPKRLLAELEAREG
jgi:hypothetical protein